MLRLVSRTSSSSDDPLAALAAEARSGGAAGARRFIIAIGPVVVGIVRRVLGPRPQDVEDVCQESMFAVMAALPTFRGECRTEGFVARVTALTALAARRRLRYREQWTPAVEPSVADRMPDVQGHSPLSELEAARLRAMLRALLDELPEPQADALALHFVLGYSVAEVADIVQVPIETVRSRLRLAKRALAQRLGDASRLDVIGGGV